MEEQKEKHTKIKDLVEGQKDVWLSAEVIENKGIEEYEIKGEKVKCCNAVLKDDTGTIKVTAWESEENKTKPHIWLSQSKRCEIQSFFVKRYEGVLSLVSGWYGRVNKLE